LVQLETHREKFAELGVNVAGMTFDSVGLLQAFHASENLGYPLLHDEKAEHVNAYGILNEDYPKGHRMYGIPHPGILLLSPHGVVIAKYALAGYRKRPPFDELYKNVEEMLP
jgi:peroxiredoxin